MMNATLTRQRRPGYSRWNSPSRLVWWLASAIPLLFIVGTRLMAPQAMPGAVRHAVVERAVDGDTIVLVGGDRVRYIGMDTPELHHPKKPVQFYAREAWLFNRQLVEGKPVRLEFDIEPRDKYGRLLAYVYLEDGTFVNAEMVRQGYARILTIPPNVAHHQQFLTLEREARAARRGLWAFR